MNLNFIYRNIQIAFFFPLIVGMGFAFGWTPCIGPILGSILALASLENTLIQGIFLLITYSIGLGIPFVLAGYYMGNFLIFSKKARKFISNIQKISGLILIVTGVLILTSKLQSIGFYLLEALPFLGKLG